MSFNLNEYLEKLETLVNIDSGSRIKGGAAKVAEHMTALYESLGLTVIKKDADSIYGPCLEIRNQPNSPEIDILLSGHMDTVFPEGTVKERPFHIEDNFGYGPGIADMKSGLISMFYLVKFILEEKLPISFCVALNSDEEISSKRSQEWIKELAKKATYAFIFEPGRKNGSYVSERKGLARYEVKFHGIPAHAGVAPQNGASAIHEMAAFILEIIKLNDYANGTSINAGIVSGGTTANVICEYAQCQIDTRFDKIEVNKKIEETLKQLSENPKDKRVKISVNREGFRPPMTMSEKTKELLELMKKKAQGLNTDMTWIKTGGGSDGNFIAFEGCIVVDGVGPCGDGLHSNNEVLFLDTIESRLNILKETIKAISYKK